MAKKPSPDEHLSPLNYRSLNATFYRAEPADYFERRLQNLILVAGNRAGLDDLLAAGVTFKDLTIGGRPPRTTSDEAGASGEPNVDVETGAIRFVTAETEVLSHHVGETLLRLYLAHEFEPGDPAPDCPLLELSRLRQPSAFRKRLEQRFDDETDPAAKRGAVANVFHVTDVRENILPAPPDASAWERSLDLLEGYLRAFAHRCLAKAPLYNAAKHGLAVTPTEMGVKYGDGSIISADGPVIQYLEVREQDPDVPRWFHVTHWVRSDLQMTLTWQAARMIQMLWSVARFRYLSAERKAGMQLHLMTGPAYHELAFSGQRPASGVEVEDMAVELLYEVPDVGGGSGEEGATAPVDDGAAARPGEP
ncbi:MAG TPA: hypothetical protein VGQ83_20790 [Polyangia bacterium]|jgi:hypothetical protein